MFALDVTLRFGVYDAAGTVDPQSSEWPPEPARLFCALVAGDPSVDEWAALEWLERQPPPEIHCSEAMSITRHQQFVITNDTRAGSPLRPGRSAAARIKPAVHPADVRFSFVWPHATPDEPILARLRALAHRVPYVGRSTSHATVAVRTSPGKPSDVVFELGAMRDRDSEVAVPFEGMAHALRAAFEEGRRAWEERRAPLPYRRRLIPQSTETTSPPLPPLSNLLMLDCDLATAYVQHTARVTATLRDAVMSRVEDPLPAALSGHDAEGAHHVGYLALPDVGAPTQLPDDDRQVARPQPNARGRLLGLALSIPVDLAAEDVRRILAAFAEPWALELPEGLRLRSGSVLVRRQAGVSSTYGATTHRWCQMSTTWATATPVVFDRYPAGRSEELMVQEALVRAGYPAPIRVVAQRAPILSGAVTHGRSSVLRRAGASTRPYCHAWVEFDQPVVGPVLAGSMRYRGLGLFAPVPLQGEVASVRGERSQPAEVPS